MYDLALKLYRCYAFGEELGDDWSTAVVEAASKRHISLERLIDELAGSAATMMSVADRGDAVRETLRKAA